MHTSSTFQLYMSSTQGGVPNATDGQQIPLQGINDYTGMILKVPDDNIDRKESWYDDDDIVNEEIVIIDRDESSVMMTIMTTAIEVKYQCNMP